MYIKLTAFLIFCFVIAYIIKYFIEKSELNINKLNSIPFKEVYTDKTLLTDGKTDVFVFNLSKIEDIEVTRASQQSLKNKPKCMKIINNKKYIPEISDYHKDSPIYTSSILHKKSGEWSLLKYYKPVDIKRKPYGFEDPRLFKWKGEIWVICTFFGDSLYFYPDNNNKQITSLTMFEYNNPDNIILLDYKYRKDIEKNWLPFEIDKELHFIYSISPFIILKYNENNKICEKIAINDGIKSRFRMGGNSPPILILKDNKEVFLSSGHLSSKNIFNNIGAIRKNFFFTFETKYPFRLIEYTPVFNFENNVYIEYVCGLELKNNWLHVHYGAEDCYNKSIIIEKDTLFSKLKPFKCIEDNFEI